MGENICKQSSWQGINPQNMQAAHRDQCQKDTQLNQKMGGRPKQTSLQRRHTMAKRHMERCLTLLTREM